VPVNANAADWLTAIIASHRAPLLKYTPGTTSLAMFVLNTSMPATCEVSGAGAAVDVKDRRGSSKPFDALRTSSAAFVSGVAVPTATEPPGNTASVPLSVNGLAPAGPVAPAEPGVPGGTVDASGTLRADGTLWSGESLRTGKALWSGWALGTSRALRSRSTGRTIGSGIAFITLGPPTP
jgi:hypothetical protein